MVFSISFRVMWLLGAFIVILVGAARDRMMGADQRDACNSHFGPGKMQTKCPMERSST